MTWNGFVKKDFKQSQRDKAFLDREISSVEPMVESHGQLYIMLYLYFSSPRCFGMSDGLSWRTIYFYLKLVMSFISMFAGGLKFQAHGPLPFKMTLNGAKVEFSLFSLRNVLPTFLGA